jgi:hypothetical protein
MPQHPRGSIPWPTCSGRACSWPPRPETSNYWQVSSALQEVLWPPVQVDPQSTPQAAQRAVDAALGVAIG